MQRAMLLGRGFPLCALFVCVCVCVCAPVCVSACECVGGWEGGVKILCQNISIKAWLRRGLVIHKVVKARERHEYPPPSYTASEQQVDKHLHTRRTTNTHTHVVSTSQDHTTSLMKWTILPFPLPTDKFEAIHKMTSLIQPLQLGTSRTVVSALLRAM